MFYAPVLTLKDRPYRPSLVGHLKPSLGPT